MINSVTIRNFKSIKDLEIELAPLTIFAGPNGSGKTSILEAIALMNQSAAGPKRVLESLRGGLTDFVDKKSIFREGNEDEALSLGFTTGMVGDLRDFIVDDIEHFRDRARRFEARRKGDNQVRPHSLHDDMRDLLVWLYRYYSGQKYAKKAQPDIGYLHSIRSDGRFHNHTLSVGSANMSYTSIGDRTVFFFKREEQKKRRSLGIIFSADQGEFLPNLLVDQVKSSLFEHLLNTLRTVLRDVYYLSAERGSIPWTYGTSPKSGATWVGRKGENTLEILSKLQKPQYDKKRLPYELFCDKFGIKRAWAGWDESNILTSNYVDPFLGSSHRFPSLGFGSRQLLSVITQLAYSDKGSILLIEEPEMSLHPAYQCLLPSLFGRAVKEGKQILATTHSSYFPLSIDVVLQGFQLQGMTTRGRKRYKIKLSVDDIRVYEVERGKKGYTTVKGLEIDENGLKKGIPSFADVEKRILGRFISRE